MRAQSYFKDKPRNIDKMRFKETLPVNTVVAYLVKTESFFIVTLKKVTN